MIPYLVVTMLKIIGLLVRFVFLVQSYTSIIYVDYGNGFTKHIEKKYDGISPIRQISLLLYTGLNTLWMLSPFSTLWLIEIFFSAFEVFLMVVSYSLYRSMAKENYQQVTYAHQLGTVNSTMSHDEGLKTIPLNTNYIV